MAAVIQYPNSQTNKTDKYRVVDYQDLINFINGATTSYAYVAFDTYEEAEKAQKIMNKDKG